MNVAETAEELEERHRELGLIIKVLSAEVQFPSESHSLLKKLSSIQADVPDIQETISRIEAYIQNSIKNGVSAKSVEMQAKIRQADIDTQRLEQQISDYDKQARVYEKKLEENDQEKARILASFNQRTPKPADRGGQSSSEIKDTLNDASSGETHESMESIRSQIEEKSKRIEELDSQIDGAKKTIEELEEENRSLREKLLKMDNSDEAEK